MLSDWGGAISKIGYMKDFPFFLCSCVRFKEFFEANGKRGRKPSLSGNIFLPSYVYAGLNVEM